MERRGAVALAAARAPGAGAARGRVRRGVVAGRGAAARLGVDPGRVEVRSAERRPRAARAPAAAHDGAGPVRILAVGRLVPDKNLDRLIAAFAEAGFAEGEAELEIRGTGPLAGELQELADRLGVPARFPGPTAAGELGDVYAAARRPGAGEHLRAVRRDAPRGRRGRSAADRLAPRRRGRRRGRRRRERAAGGSRTTARRSRTRCAGWCASPSCASGWPPAAARSPSATRPRPTRRRGSGRSCERRAGRSQPSRAGMSSRSTVSWTASER